MKSASEMLSKMDFSSIVKPDLKRFFTENFVDQYDISVIYLYNSSTYFTMHMICFTEKASSIRKETL